MALICLNYTAALNYEVLKWLSDGLELQKGKAIKGMHENSVAKIFVKYS